jgi:hypothetical protein
MNLNSSMAMKNPSSEMLRSVALVKTDVSEERSDSVIRVTRIREVGKTLAVTSNLRTLEEIIVGTSKSRAEQYPKDAILHGHRPYYVKSYIVLSQFNDWF